jgi:hypothetical protein
MLSGSSDNRAVWSIGAGGQPSSALIVRAYDAACGATGSSGVGVALTVVG